MISVSRQVTVGEVLEEDVWLTFDEVARCCDVSPERLKAIVDEGVIEPAAPYHAGANFCGDSLSRVSMVVRLEDQLGVNLAGAALAIELLGELKQLRSQVRTLQVGRHYDA